MIDSMIWVYNYDPNAPEHNNVKKWLRAPDGVLAKEKVLLSAIIPLEVMHVLFRKARLPFDLVFNATQGIINLANGEVVELTLPVVQESMRLLGTYQEYGIGGRDASILATMTERGTDTIATHDKGLLRVPEFNRVDPVFDPPAIYPLGQPFVSH